MASSTIAGLDALDQPQATGAAGTGTATRAWRATWPKLLAVALVLAIWEAIHLTRWKELIFPAPGSTLASLWDQLGTGLLWHAIGTTLYRAVIGFALALVIGSVVGALVSRARPLRAAVGSLITGLQTMPSIAWFPFAIILFGLTTQAIMFVIVLGAAPSIANGLIAGVDYTPPLLLKAGHMMGLRRLSLYRHLIVPASLPAFVAGLKQGWAFAWRSLMAGELLVVIANQPSLGVLLSASQEQADMVGATAIIIVILVIGVLVDSGFSAADRALRRRWGLS
jgi:NitT/TauT family transport system permease protein